MSSKLLFPVIISALFSLGQGVVNFALNKSANQSSTLNYNGFNWTADKAVDGNSDGRNAETTRTCSATKDTSNVYHTWEVDIGVKIIVKKITVFGRTGLDDNQLEGFTLSLGNTSGPWNYGQQLTSSHNEDMQYVFEPDNVIARFISLKRSANILVICEVTVEGECRRGNYGSGCNEICGNCYKGNNSCSLTNGRCMEGCETGWRGDICKNECEAGTYGFNCKETCGHCLNGNNSCSKTSGKCSGGCQAGWKGETCKSGVVNFALNKSANQSSTLNYNGFNWTADKAVDGNSDGRNAETTRTCSATKDTSNVYHTWEVDIGVKIIVKKITVFGRTGLDDNQLEGFTLSLGNTSGPWNYGQQLTSSHNEDMQYVFEPDNVIARFISLKRSANILVICEVTVEGECRRGNYGSGCNEICGNCYKGNNSCSLTNGTCMEGCETGWRGDICNNECEAGTYGFNCKETCGHCLNGNNSCSKTSGKCSGGCQAGWKGETCKSGVVNFAMNKSANQSSTLNYNGFNWTADKAVDGNSDGSSPKTIRTCSGTKVTSNVNHTWEVDIGVQIIVKMITVYGRTDTNDNQLEGFTLSLGNTSGPWNYGQQLISSHNEDMQYVFEPDNVIARFISLKRSANILVICEVTVEGECRRGNYGSGCNEICGNCYKGNNSCSLTNGTCMEGCETGWRGDICKNECEAGTYGFNCKETCGHSLNGNNSCSKTSGKCSGGCQAGWKGETCKSECEVGTYGFNCNETCGYCLIGNNNCSKIIGHCTGGCQRGWRGDTCKSECEAGTYGYHCNETCGNCLNGNNSCSKISGQCTVGCQTGWRAETCKSECKVGTYGFNCNEICGYCVNGNNSCSKVSGQCTGGCQSGWRGETCKSGLLETVTPGDVGPNTGVIIGSVLAAVGVSICAMVIIIVIVKKRKRNNNETGTENVTPFKNSANLVVGNPDTAIRITVPSREERETAFSAIEKTYLQNGMPIGATNIHIGVMEADVPVHNVYEKLRDVPESTESAYSTIDQNLIHDQKMNNIENGSNYIETLQELESALKSIEEEIGVLLDRKEKLLCKELERSRAIKLRDKRKETDSSQSDTNKDYTYINLERKDALERCGNCVEMLQSLEGEMRLLEEKRKCLFERKKNLLSQELAKTFKI